MAGIAERRIAFLLFLGAGISGLVGGLLIVVGTSEAISAGCSMVACPSGALVVAGVVSLMLCIIVGQSCRRYYRSRIVRTSRWESSPSPTPIPPEGTNQQPALPLLPERVDSDGTRWFRNTLDGKWVHQTVPLVGVHTSGLRIPRQFGKVQVVPWARVIGPSKQMFKEFWVLYFGRPDGSFSYRGAIEVSYHIARVVVQEPRCLRKRVTEEDLQRLGLPSSPHP